MANKKYYWLKLKNDFFNDIAMKKLRKIAGGDTYTIIYLKMMLHSIDKNGIITYKGYEDDIYSELGLELDEDEENVKVTFLFLERYGMIEGVSENEYKVPAAIENTGSETQEALRQRRHRNKYKTLQCNGDVTHESQCSNGDVTHESRDGHKNVTAEKEIDIEKDIEIDIEKDIDTEKEKRNVQKDAQEFFERVWKLYPCKKGKTQISYKKKRELMEFDFETIEHAIDKYKAELKKETWKNPMNGSTFFNGRFRDYIGDETEEEQRQTQGRNLDSNGFDKDSEEYKQHIAQLYSTENEEEFRLFK